MSIDPIRSRIGTELPQVERSKLSPPPSKLNETSEDRSEEKRKEEIPSSHRFHSRLLSSAQLILETLTDVRKDRLREVEARIKEGFYNSPEVLSEVAKRMVYDPEVISGSSSLIGEPSRREEIEQRISEGFYDRPEVKQMIAQRMIIDANKREI